MRRIIGEWIGEGYCHGEAVTGRMHGAAVIDGSWIEVEETHRRDAWCTRIAHHRFNGSGRLEAIQLFEREHDDELDLWMTGRWITDRKPPAPL